jgi:hypothetical protein
VLVGGDAGRSLIYEGFFAELKDFWYKLLFCEFQERAELQSSREPTYGIIIDSPLRAPWAAQPLFLFLSLSRSLSPRKINGVAATQSWCAQIGLTESGAALHNALIPPVNWINRVDWAIKENGLDHNNNNIVNDFCWETPKACTSESDL